MKYYGKCDSGQLTKHHAADSLGLENIKNCLTVLISTTRKCLEMIGEESSKLREANVPYDEMKTIGSRGKRK